MRWRRQVQRFAELARRHYVALISLSKLGIPSDIIGLIEQDLLRNTMPFIGLTHSLLRCLGSGKAAERKWQDLCAQRNAFIHLFGTLVHHKRFFYGHLLKMPDMVLPLHEKLRQLQTVTTAPQQRRFMHIADACECMFSRLLSTGEQRDNKYQYCKAVCCLQCHTPSG